MCISFLLKPDQAKGKQTKTNKMLITSFKNYSRKKNKQYSTVTQLQTHTHTNHTKLAKNTAANFSIQKTISLQISRNKRNLAKKWQREIGTELECWYATQEKVSRFRLLLLCIKQEESCAN